MNPSTFRTNLKTLLDANTNYSTLGAKVHKYPPGKQAGMVPTVFMHEVRRVAQEDQSLLGDQQAVYEITGGAYAPSAGAADAQWTTADTNAYTLIEGLINELVADNTVGTVCAHARVADWTMTPSTTEDGRVFVTWSGRFSAGRFS